MSLHSRSQAQSTSNTHSLTSQSKLRIAFIHPDLGIGGAERLVVDAAVGLQKRGHLVQVFTSSHHHNRCFQETRDGQLSIHTFLFFFNSHHKPFHFVCLFVWVCPPTTGTLNVNVLGNSIFPRAFANRFITILAILRQFHLSLQLIFTIWSSSLLGSSNPTGFDIYFIDQLSASIPLLRYATRTRVIFYCHFPDLLLSKPIPNSHQTSHSTGLIQNLKLLYRIPLDWVEEYTTGS